MAEEELDDAVNDIIAQIKGNNKTVREKKEDVTIDKENFNDYISSAPENRDVAALAEVIKATSASIDTLQKLHSSNERNETQKEVKKMDVESKERLNIADNQTRMLLSRDDIMKALIDKDDDVIDV